MPDWSGQLLFETCWNVRVELKNRPEQSSGRLSNCGVSGDEVLHSRPIEHVQRHCLAVAFERTQVQPCAPGCIQTHLPYAPTPLREAHQHIACHILLPLRPVPWFDIPVEHCVILLAHLA